MLVTRSIDPKDRRYVILSLTAEGNEKYKEVTQYMHKFVDNLFKYIPDELHNQIQSNLEVIVKALKKMEDE